MSKTDGAASNTSIMEIDMLSELVERQLDDVAGGGYSQFTIFHKKDGTTEPTIPTEPEVSK